MTTGSDFAPGAPGSSPHWAPAEKIGVGTALSPNSPVWFTLSQGILTEVFYPFVDAACIRDMGLLVADGKDFFSEERRDTKSRGKPSWPRRAGLPPGQHLQAGALSRRKDDPLRPAPCRPPPTNPLYPSPGAIERLLSLRPAGAAPGQRGGRQHRVDRRLQGHAHAVRPARRLHPGPGLLPTVARSFGRVRRRLGRLAGRVAAQENGMALWPSRERQRGPDRRGGPRGDRRPFRAGPGLRPGRVGRGTPGAGRAAPGVSGRPRGVRAAVVRVVEGSSAAGSVRRPGLPPVPRQRGRDAHARIQGIQGRHHRQFGHTLGLRPRGRRSRLPFDLAPRHDRDGDRPPGSPAARGRPAACCSISASRRTPTGTGRRTWR